MEMQPISTGLRELDRLLDGGIPRGVLACLESPPASQYNPLFYRFMEDHKWLYVSTYRSEAAVNDEFSDLLWRSDICVEHVGVERPIKNMHSALQDLEDDRHVIVDTTNPLETAPRESQYVHLLNGLKEYLMETGTIAILHSTVQDTPPDLREVTLTVADLVWELEFVVNGQRTENHLTVPKFRSTELVEEVIKLDLGEDVSIDVSKNIA